ncbi:MAG TPA: nicotinamide riboside transporter PnuC [Gammaproteobacteria bacterium]|jgi:nicotinamide mononucleotide transporter
MTAIFALFREVSTAELAAVALAIAYLLLAIRQNILCWPAALLSSLIYLWVFYTARLYMESVLQLFYAAMAVYGWHQWLHGGSDGHGLRISTWSPMQHLKTLGFIAVLTGAFGFALSRTDAAFPFVDSFTSVAAVFTTYMVARKVLENWVYWFVIDSVSVYLYLARGLNLTAALFVLYLALVIVGFRRWAQDLKVESAGLKSGACG